MVNKSMIRGGGGGGGGATYVFKVPLWCCSTVRLIIRWCSDPSVTKVLVLPWLQMENGIHKPLLIAAGGGGRGYNSHADDQKEIMDTDPQVPGRNGLSAAAGSFCLQGYYMKKTFFFILIVLKTKGIHMTEQCPQFWYTDSTKNFAIEKSCQFFSLFFQMCQHDRGMSSEDHILATMCGLYGIDYNRQCY